MSNTKHFKQRTVPVYEGLQYDGKNGQEVKAFLEGILSSRPDSREIQVRVGGGWVKLTWANGVSTVIRKSWWVLTSGDQDVSVFTEDDVAGYFREVNEPKKPVVKKLK